MVQETIERYHSEINSLAIKAYNEQITFKNLIEAIEKRKNDSAGDRAAEEFYLGEINFFEGQYDRALKHYLLATSTTNLPFYCYRATASLFLSQGNSDKAAGFTQKALKIYPDDYPTLKILEKLLLQGNQPEDLVEVQNKIKALEKEQHVDEQSQNPVEKSTEPSMNSGSDIFSFPQVEETASTSTLTERLYPTKSESAQGETFKFKPETGLLSDLQYLSKNPIENVSGDSLLRKMETFQEARLERLHAYLENARHNAAVKEDLLFFLSGYATGSDENDQSLYLTDALRNPSGGIFFNWAGKGVVINPGRHFLENFHAQGLTVRDIHFVIVTNDLPENSSDVQSLYELNYQINKTTQSIHLIHYYFSQKAFQELSKTLKPHFKQERDALHALEFFADSPDVERVDLSPEISLNYFLTSGTNLGVKLELKSEKLEESSLTLGYLTNTGWTAQLPALLGRCDLVVAGFGQTSINDYRKAVYNSDSLGFHGTANLLRDTAPQVLLCGEVEGNQGDLRLEIVQKLREESASTTVLAADNGLVFDLRTFAVQSSLTQEWTEASLVRTVRESDFGALIYVSPDSIC